MRVALLCFAFLAVSSVAFARKEVRSRLDIIQAPQSAGFPAGTHTVTLNDASSVLSYSMGVKTPSNRLFSGEGSPMPQLASSGRPSAHVMIVVPGTDSDLSLGEEESTSYSMVHTETESASGVASFYTGRAQYEHGVSMQSERPVVPTMADSFAAAFHGRVKMVSASASMSSAVTASSASVSGASVVTFDAQSDSYTDGKTFTLTRSEIISRLVERMTVLNTPTTMNAAHTELFVSGSTVSYSLASGSADMHFLAELIFLEEVAASKVFEEEKTFLFETLVFSGLDGIKAESPSEAKIAVCKRLLRGELKRIVAAVKLARGPSALISMSLLNTVSSTSMRLRRDWDGDAEDDQSPTPCNSTTGYPYPDWPPIFQISLWLSFALILTLTAIIYVIGSMDSGSYYSKSE